ncbi:MAG TPA: fibronectin type III domain-containing protein, partial [Tepidisphaeraceae bacterium]|nr:fibronectin type III domain-containing protein [Tepidisphaeraceae bacterium]
YKVVAANGPQGTLTNVPLGREMKVTTLGTPAPGPTTPVPATPDGLTASGSTGRVTLAWNPAAGATSYRVERQAAGGAFAEIASGVTTTGYADTAVTNGTTYTYRVRAENSTGTSDYTATASGTPTVGVTPPPTPGDPTPVEPTPVVADRNLGTIGSKTKKTKNRLRTSDTDYVYKFTLAKRSKVSLSLSGMKQNVDLYLQENDGDPIRSSRRSKTRTDKVSTTLDAGTYHVRVLLNASKSTSYKLSVSAKAVKSAAGKTNRSDLPDPVVPFAVDRSLGTLGRSTQRVRDREVSAADADAYYKFKLSRDTEVSAKLFNLDANADLVLLDANGNKIRSSTKSGTATDRISRTLDDGTYYLQVKLANGAFATGYSIDLSGKAR